MIGWIWAGNQTQIPKANRFNEVIEGIAQKYTVSFEGAPSTALFVVRNSDCWCHDNPSGIYFTNLKDWTSTSGKQSFAVVAWLTPSLGALAYVFLVLLIFTGLALYFLAREATDSTSEEYPFGEAVAHYAADLEGRGQDAAVLKLQEGIGYLLHTRGDNESRASLGEKAYEAAVRLSDLEAQFRLLIDDLGWANYMVGNESEAKKNIVFAIQQIGGLPSADATDQTTLLHAKAVRHLAIIHARSDLPQARAHLDNSETILALVSNANRRARQIEIGQVMHARATCILINMALLSEGVVLQSDLATRTLVEEAQINAQNACEVFRECNSHTRYTKGLFQLARTFEALGRDLELRRVQTLLTDAARKTTWDIKEPTNIRGGAVT